MIKAFIFTVTLLCSLSAQSGQFKGTVWERVGSEYGIDASLLYSVALVESGVARTDSDVSPWPYTLRVKHFNYYGDSKEEAEAVLSDFLEEHGTGVDVGVGQINLYWHGHRVKSPHDLLDLETNLRVMAEILSETQRSTKDKELQIGRYHSWKEDLARAYARKVNLIRNRLDGMLDSIALASAR